MNKNEFSERFDTLYNNITSNQAPGLNNYEISVFLTKAQDEIVKNYFNPKSNKLQEGFDGNRKRQIDFSAITHVYDTDAFNDPMFDSRPWNKSIQLPDKVWFIINERLVVTRSTGQETLTVLPITFEEYDRLMSKPYKRPLKYQAWRILNNEHHPRGSTNHADLIVGPGDTLDAYMLRYISQPSPIIVGDLDGLTINNCYLKGGTVVADAEAVDGECVLDEMLHEEILQRAVELAKVAWTSTGQDNTQAVLQAGQRSE